MLAKGDGYMQPNTKVITVIPRKQPIKIDVETGIKIKKRVCAYARVSTDLEDQKNSFNAQLREYEERIKTNPDWEFVRLYSDEGLTGTMIKSRKGFQEMINDALEGKIDIILTKSISRFARNTVDCIKTARELREKGVVIYFEKEHISTDEMQKVEMMLTIFASMAQEEAKSISENVTWGIRSRMKRGVVHYYDKMLGYSKLPNGTVKVHAQESQIVKRIFNLAIMGYTSREIADEMIKKGYKTGTGKEEWTHGYINSILKNEKYCGDVILQKTICDDFLSHHRAKNTGQEPKYHIQDNHEAIIPRALFAYVQTLRKARYQQHSNYITSDVTPLGGLVFCEHCLRVVRIITTHPNTNYSKKVLTCKTVGRKNQSYLACPSRTIAEDLVLEALKEAINYLNGNKNNNITADVLEALMIDPSVYQTYYERKTEISILIEKVDDEIRDLIDSQKDGLTPNYTKDYAILKTRRNELLKKIQLIDDEFTSQNEKYAHQYKIIEALNEGNVISPLLVREYIIRIYKRNDNSIRFISSTAPLTKDEINNLNEYFLSAPASYSSSIESKGKTLNYDIVIYGGRKND